MARYLKIGKESAYNTSSAGTYTLAAVSESIKLNQGFIRSRTVDFRDLRRSVGGPKVVDGGWEQYVNYLNIGLILKALMGSEAVANPAGTAYTHTFTPNALGSLPSLTVRLGLHGVTEKIATGYGVDSVKFEAAPGEYLKATVSGVGADLATGTVDAAPTFDSQAYATITDTFTIGGTAATPEKFSLTVKNNVKSDHHVITTRTLPRLEAGEFDVSGEMDIRFTSGTHMTDFLNATRRELIAKWQGALIAGSEYNQLTFTVDNIEYDVDDAYVDRQERIVEGLKFTGVKGTDDVLTIVLENTDTAAY